MKQRELKFRAWNGAEMVYDVTVGKFGAFYVNPGSKGNGLDEKDSASLTPFNTKYSDTIPVMLSTGLSDKNGKEIYEGDILEVNMGMSKGGFYSNGGYEPPQEIKYFRTVEWKIDDAKLDWAGSRSGSTLCAGNCKYFTVIGNIYETPESA